MGCTESDLDPRSIKNGAYSNSAFGLSMTFPPVWQFRTDQKYGDVVPDLVAIGPPIANFSPNVNIIAGAHSSSADWATELPQIKTQILAQITDATAWQDTVVVIDGHDLARIEYESTQAGFLLHYRQYLLVNRGKQIVVTFSDRAAHFPANEDFPGIVASMRVY